MKASNRVDRKLFHAIKFKDLPFNEIDKYVCVPSSWIIHELDDQKALVAYPENEAPFVTRNRVKKREEHSSEWRYYTGYFKFESESYECVEQWIEKMITNGGDDQEEESLIKDSLLQPVGNRQLRSSRNPLWSGALPDKPQVIVRPYDNPRRPLPKILIRRPLPLRPWKPKRMEPDKTAEPANTAPSKQDPTVIEENHSNEESVDMSVQSSPKPSDEKQPVRDEQLLDMSNTEEFTEDIEIEIQIEEECIEDQKSPSKTSEQAHQSNPVNERPASTHHEYSLLESRLYEIHTGQPKEPNAQKTPTVRPPSRANQPSHDYAQPLPVNTPCSKPQLQRPVVSSSEVTHSYQNSHLHYLLKATPSHSTPSPIDLSSHRQVPTIRRKSWSVIKKPAEKKTRVENITTSKTTSQSLSNKQLNYAGNVGDVIDQRPLQSVNTSAAKNLSHLAQQTRFCEPSHLQYMQHLARMQNAFSRSNIDQRSYFQNAVTGGYGPQNHPGQINQPRQLLPQHQNQRPLVNTNQMQEMMRHEHLNGPLNKPAQHLLARNLEIPPIQDPPSYQDPRVVKPLESQSNSGNPKVQVTEEQHLVPPKTSQQLSNNQRCYSHKDPRLVGKLGRSSTNYYEIRGTDPETSQDSETQTTSESQKTESKNVYKHPESKKLVVDQATEMDSTNDHREDETVASHSESMDSGYRIDKHSAKEQEIPLEVPDSEMVSADEELLDNVSTDDDSDYAMDDDICSDENTSPSIAEERTIDAHNLIPETHQKLSKMAEDEMLEIHSHLLSKIYKNFIDTEEFYNNLQNSTLGCIQLYEMLLNKTEKVKMIKSLSIPTSNAAPEVTQMAEEIPIAASKQKNSNSKKSNNSSVKNSMTKKKKRHTFVLPPEYDPNNTRWTLKHRDLRPGLTELIPQSHVYVSKAEYKKCIRSSNNYRMLARLLLTAIFSKNALSVCSPTGARARAFNTVDIDVRPGLDEHARMVLLAFIEEYGNKRNWNTSDTAGIMSSIRTKIQELRNKYGKTITGLNSILRQTLPNM